jgi:CRISPR-associated protein Cmr6
MEKKKNTINPLFGKPEDNFYLRYYKIPYFKHFDKIESKLLNEFELPVFKEQFIKTIALKQLLGSQALCDNLPIRVEAKADLPLDFTPIKENNFSTNWNMTVGKGIASVFESGMSLHHIYGIPYIPASAVKGLLRSWLITEYFTVNDNEENPVINAEFNALGNPDFCKIFGCPADRRAVKIEDNKPKEKRKGEYVHEKPVLTAFGKEHIGDIVFFDAFPTKPPTVAVDIMNPHYPKYYNHEPGSKDFQPPADWQSPVPIFFLTVKDTSFQFLFGVRKGAIPFKDVNFIHSEDTAWNKKGNVIEVLKALLTEALANHGIGAKTAVGYGRMKQS